MIASAPSVVITAKLAALTTSAGADLSFVGNADSGANSSLRYLCCLDGAAASGVHQHQWNVGGGLSDVDVRLQRAAYNTGFTSVVYPSTWQKTTATKATLMGVPPGDTSRPSPAFAAAPRRSEP